MALLVYAFASVTRRSVTPVSGMWLAGWMMIQLHFTISLFRFATGIWGVLVSTIMVGSLVWAGVLFQSAMLPYRQRASSLWMRGTLIATNTLYLALLFADGVPDWALNLSAALIGLGPLLIFVIDHRNFNHLLRRVTVLLSGSLSIFILFLQHSHGNGDLALNALLFSIYAGCCIDFWYSFNRPTAGAVVTITGFFLWANVFSVAPIMARFLPHLHVESEVWNLPKYLVAVGMILLVLEDQIEHNKYLALHDELTGLANRRLFQDRLTTALERSRRNGTQTALLVVDLDRFKEVNDTLGHHAGDLLLQDVGKALVGRVRRTDTVARTGGDEFSLILEPSSRADAEGVGASLLQLLQRPMDVDTHSVKVGASLGIALFPDDAPDEEQLQIAADLRMYKHKKKTRNLLHQNALPPTGEEEEKLRLV